MYPVRGDKDPLVTLIPASQVIPLFLLLLTPVDPPTKAAGLCSLTPSYQDILLALPGNLLYNVLLAQRSSPDGMALLSKLTPEHPKEDAYTLKESIVYQNKRIGFLRACVCVS
ncbi:hypothetical protein DSO57_1032072 [Entomophthora muscae]|uniref:Uncharacterized protein n=1 Tax=Entomophthora muscae TaxID=34485 RepID=A0ACC2TBD2_9FUNG|nr:hypothetical protein DSO57_1032072 [Entomophthora muscae]